MFSIFQRAISVAVYPAAYLYLWAQSEITRIKSWNKAPVIHSEMPYDGQKIMLLALYQKGKLRPDTVRLLKHAKAAGLYVLAVNTLRLKNPADTDGLIDCYIERFNFGRDFGSYRCGFLHLFRKGWHTSCPRLLMINDSVFFSDERMPQFLDDMMSSATEVLGSTENYEIEYHLGSFCIAMAGDILRQPKFQTYWRSYTLSDVRPTVIFRGEMRLSRTLKRCVSSPDQMRALYNSHRFTDVIKDADDAAIDRWAGLTRTSNVTPARLFNARDQLEEIESRYSIDFSDLSDVKLDGATMDEVTKAKFFIGNFSDLKEVLAARSRNGQSISPAIIRSVFVANLIHNFRRHSQIHQNAAILLTMGLPIIKLDGVYRGMFNLADVAKIAKLLPSDEAVEMQELLLDRPYGEEVLFGWKRAAFMRGLI